jgi:hypothetical protein
LGGEPSGQFSIFLSTNAFRAEFWGYWGCKHNPPTNHWNASVQQHREAIPGYDRVYSPRVIDCATRSNWDQIARCWGDELQLL